MRRHFLPPLALPLALLALAAAACAPAEGGDPQPTATPTPSGPSVEDPRRENAALYDGLAADLPSLTGGSRQARVDEFWTAIAREGGLPARAEGRLVFALRSPDDGWSVAGTFNAWTPDADPLTRIAGTDTLVADLAVTPGRHQYKLVRNGEWIRDPAARWVQFDGIDTGTVGAFNAVAYAGAQSPLAPSDLWLLPFSSSAVGNTREVFVQVPSSYWPARAPLPLLVMHDGNESITRGRFDAALDTARAAGSAPAVLVAYVALADQADRMDEYTFGTTGARGLLYETLVADELVPALEDAFATPRTPEARAVMGASLGGLISYRIGLDRPDVFLRTAGQSSSFFWNSDQILGEFSDATALPGRWYLDAGEDADNGIEAAQMRDILMAKGAEHEYVRDPAGLHDWSYWAARLPHAVDWLFAP